MEPCVLLSISDETLTCFQRCRFCNNVGASIGCCVKSCRMSFHFPCGIANGVLAQYFGTFRYFNVPYSRNSNSLYNWICCSVDEGWLYALYSGNQVSRL